MKTHLLDKAKEISEIIPPKFIQSSLPKPKMQFYITLENNICMTREDSSTPLNIGFPGEKNLVDSVNTDDVFQPIGSKKEKTQFFESKAAFHYDNCGDITTITGNAGSGKTTFLKILLAQYAEKDHLFGYNFVFYIPCSSVDFDYEGNLLEFLAIELPFLWIKNLEICNAIISNLNEKEKVCILLDGLDINKIKINDDSDPKVESRLTMSSKNFIKKILEKELLLKSKVLITMRPLQFSAFKKSKFYKNCQNKFYILGLNHEDQVNICQHVTCTKFEKIINYIDEHTDLKVFCLNPTNFLAVSYFLDKFMSTNKEDLIPLFHFPLVQIFIPSLLLITWNFGLKNLKSDLTYAVELAWKMFFSNKLMFCSESDVHEVHQHSQVLKTYLQIFPPVADLNTDLTFSAIVFSCLIAMHLLCFHDSFEDYITNVIKPQFLKLDSCFFKISKFLYGLCNCSVTQYLKKLFPCLSRDILKTMQNNKVKIMKDLIKEVMSKKFDPQSNMIAVFSFVFELHDNEFAKEIAESLPDNIELTESLLKDHFTGLPYVLSMRKRKILITCPQAMIDMQVFKKNIKILQTLENVTLLPFSGHSHLWDDI